VIVHYFDIVRILFPPNETDAILIVDPDAVLAGAISPQCFKPVSWQRPKI
jgi:hypothetical protein